MAHVQIIAVTTADVGPLGPEKRLYAVNLGTADEALDVVRKRLKPQERAVWLETRSLTLGPGEVRQI